MKRAEKIAQITHGFEIRQAEREARRKQLTDLKSIFRMRKEGLLDSLPKLEAYCASRDIKIREDVKFGCTVVALSCGGPELCYTPNGKLDYRPRHKKPDPDRIDAKYLEEFRAEMTEPEWFKRFLNSNQASSI